MVESPGSGPAKRVRSTTSAGPSAPAIRAVGLLSGGLDSTLAVRVVQEQGVEVLGLTFRSCFFETLRAEEAASRLGIPLRTIDFSAEHLELVRNPPHGYGKCLNPCIDCHALMLRHAGQLMEAEGYDFLFTGEVLGERPMSQNRQSLAIVAEESGYADFLLRPLSARLLPPTKCEREGLLDRSRLLSIRGRSRKPQMALAAQYHLTEYPTPAGGCRLTDPNFTKRLADLFAHARATPRDIELLKLGRHFRLSPSVKVVMGRNRLENERLLALRRPGERHLVVIGPPAPDVIIPGTDEVSEEHILFAARLAVTYSDAPQEEPATVHLRDGDQERDLLVRALPRAEAQAFLI